MKSKLVIDGNSIYEIDEECIRKKEENEKKNIDFRKRGGLGRKSKGK